jgi:hypothetical protein
MGALKNAKTMDGDFLDLIGFNRLCLGSDI